MIQWLASLSTGDEVIITRSGPGESETAAVVKVERITATQVVAGGHRIKIKDGKVLGSGGRAGTGVYFWALPRNDARGMALLAQQRAAKKRAHLAKSSTWHDIAEPVLDQVLLILKPYRELLRK